MAKDGESGRGRGRGGDGQRGGDRDRERDRNNDDHRGRGGDDRPERRGDDHNGGGNGNHGGDAFLSAPPAPIATMTITRPDGMRERLVNGQYERYDPQGRLVERRQATGSDVLSLRLGAMNHSAQVAPSHQGGGQSRPTRVHIRGGDVSVLYSNGWTEAVTQGRFRMTDRYGNVAIDRAATSADTTRLRSLAGL